MRERRAVELQQSQMLLTDLTVEGAVAFNDDNQFATIRIPRRELLDICPDAESRLAEPLVANPGIRDVIARYFALAANSATSLDPIGQQMTARHMVDLVALLLHTDRDRTQLAVQRGYSEARLRLIQTEVLGSSPRHQPDHRIDRPIGRPEPEAGATVVRALRLLLAEWTGEIR